MGGHVCPQRRHPLPDQEPPVQLCLDLSVSENGAVIRMVYIFMKAVIQGEMAGKAQQVRLDGRDVAAQPPERGGELFGILICPIVERESQLAPFGRLCLGTAGGGLVARLPSACLGFLLAALLF